MSAQVSGQGVVLQQAAGPADRPRAQELKRGECSAHCMHAQRTHTHTHTQQMQLCVAQMHECVPIKHPTLIPGTASASGLSLAMPPPDHRGMMHGAPAPLAEACHKNGLIRHSVSLHSKEEPLTQRRRCLGIRQGLHAAPRGTMSASDTEKPPDQRTRTSAP